MVTDLSCCAVDERKSSGGVHSICPAIAWHWHDYCSSARNWSYNQVCWSCCIRMILYIGDTRPIYAAYCLDMVQWCITACLSVHVVDHTTPSIYHEHTCKIQAYNELWIYLMVQTLGKLMSTCIKLLHVEAALETPQPSNAHVDNNCLN